MRKQDYERLFQAGQVIAHTKNPQQLLENIIALWKPFFGFNDIGLFIVSEDKTTVKDWAVTYQNISPSEVSKIFKARGDDVMRYLGSVLEWAIDQLERADRPVVFDYQELQIKFPEWPYFETLLSHSIPEGLSGLLQVGGKTLGLLNFNATIKGHFTSEHFALFQAICDQLAVAVSNVLAIEQLLEEKQFKDTLLGISEAVAQIQDRKKLFKVIFERIQPLVKFDDFGLFHFDESGNYHRDLAVTDGHSSETNRASEAGIEEYLPNHASVDVFVQKGPLVLSLNELMERFPGHPFYPFMRGVGLKQIFGGPLMYQGKKIGMLAFNSKQDNFYSEQDFPLFQAIADQLAVAVSNVLANEQLLAEKKKTEDLLAVTESIANITTGPELVRAIFDKLQKVFLFDDAGLFHLDFENERERDLIVDYSYEIGINFTLKEHGLKGWLPITGATKHIIIKQLVMMGTEIYDELEHPHFEQPDVRIFKSVIAAALKKGKNTIGLLYFWSKEENAFDGQLPLFKSITDQMSVALSNIIANEDIQQREKEKALQVALVNALNEETNWDIKLLTIAKLLRPYFPFSTLSFNMPSVTATIPALTFEEIGANEYRTLSSTTFLKLTELEQKTYQQALNSDDLSKTTIISGKSLYNKAKNNSFLKGMVHAFNTKSIMVFPITVTDNRKLYISFSSRNDKTFAQEHIALFNTISDSFTLGLEKQLHYQEVLRLNEQISQEKAYLEKEVQLQYNFGEIIGQSEAMKLVFDQVRQVANINSNVLITGETGTGKELIARSLHRGGNRAKYNFIKLNCATLPAELLESELFGHEKGAFTGADKRRIGKFELAHRGTIFLDEIGEMPIELQAKLLRVLQEREFERLGGNEVIQPDVRVIAATNRNLEVEVANNTFRSDLFYRLNVFPIHVPPLRERKEDIPELVQHFLKKHGKRVGKNIKRASDKSLKALLNYSWPGNIRELEHIIERAMIVSKSNTLEVVIGKSPAVITKTDDGLQPLKTYRQAEIDLIMNTLKFTNGRISGEGGAAAILNMNRSTLESKMRKLGIKRKHSIE
ncbi:sigma 54-interacting transcriptional regulator [Aquimarina sp. U1-2]|uniref:sigma 54-interacting transcriptional regulator n=1 Tax=Aquimarina sp. U1-2 TaxID=2823141 RepID=UPI001AECCCB8|nr:sigma 54-interacting transcriptional regulator [Aquimarina sp. U1-2]MBP2833099.1 sigma 54-interacting transcriptional regulator [Aquimarina sp. U1-2]